MNSIEKRLDIINYMLHESNKFIKCIDNCGNTYWHTKYSMKFHRDNNLPAIIRANGEEEY